MNTIAKATAGVALGIGLMSLAGCATTGYTQSNDPTYTAKNIMEVEALIRARQKAYQNKFKDSYDGKRIMEEVGDLYLENLDGNEKIRLTHTPQIKETWAFFTKEGKYIIYKTTNDNFTTDQAYLLSINEQKTESKEISDQEWNRHTEEKFRGYNYWDYLQK